MTRALDNGGCFAGIRVLEFGTSIASTKACMMLADNGADVVKITSPVEAMELRSPGYYVWNRGKRCLPVDAAPDQALQTIHHLLRSADVAVFDCHAEQLERHGLTVSELQARYPALLVVTMPPLGEAGHLRDLPADDFLLGAAAGVAFAQFAYADQPIHLVIPLLSYGQAMIGAAAIAAGLYERLRSGLGQHIVASGLHGVAIHEGGTFIGSGPDGDEVRRRVGNDSRGQGIFPNLRLYQCSDNQWLLISAMAGSFVVNAFMLLGMEDLLIDPRFSDGVRAAMLVQETAREVEARMSATFRTKTRDEWLRLLAEADVPAAAVQDRDTWFAAEQIKANEMHITLADPEVGKVEMVGLSLKFSESPGKVKPREIVEDAEWLPRQAAIIQDNSPNARPRSGPLAGITVFDLSQFVSGAVCGTALADFGADVVKIEPLHGDEFRAHRVSFIGWNRGKRTVAIDLKNPTGRAAFYDLVKQADVVVENYRYGVAKRLAIDYEVLSKINPRLVVCSISGYGHSGPLAPRPGFDPILAAESGMQHAQGGGDEPVFLQMGINDTGSGAMACLGVIAALLQRARTGFGQHVQTCLANQSVLGQSGELARYPGARPPESGARDCIGRTALFRFYRCLGDRWIAIACRREAHFHNLSLALRHEEWSDRWTGQEALIANVDGPLAAAIQQAFSGLSEDEALAVLRREGIPSAPARRLSHELFNDAHLNANDFWHRYERADDSPLTMVAHYAQWSRTPVDPPYLPGAIGENSIEFLREMGFCEDRIAELVSSGTIGIPKIQSVKK